MKRRKRKLYNSPRELDKEHAVWSRAVRSRDKHKCQFPGCKCKGTEAHHIIRYADAPLLRYNIFNGITLCRKHHKLVTGKEQIYILLFSSIVNDNNKR